MYSYSLLHYAFLLGVNFTDLSSVKKIFYPLKNEFILFSFSILLSTLYNFLL